ncbi:MAG: hypothetical protein A3K18_28280 [Lentisphaerae bacterium RIFOXYA12_64_32]|nr:MAG: hypothetical protein A3K18_28280 [Lentisphaerae bacterium RIFOXYA12_64_32]
MADFIKAAKNSDDLGVDYLRKLTSPQLLDLCNEYGKAVDDGSEGKEGIVIEIVLGSVKEKGDLKLGTLLAVAADPKASRHWRTRAVRYCSGRDKFVDFRSEDIPVAVDALLKLLSDPNEVPQVRVEACNACGEILARGYQMLLCKVENRKETFDRKLRARTRTEDLPVWAPHDKRVGDFVLLICNLASTDGTPELLTKERIPSALREIVTERGTKTPQLQEIQRLLNAVRERQAELPNAYRNLAREVDEAASPVRAADGGGGQ